MKRSWLRLGSFLTGLSLLLVGGSAAQVALPPENCGTPLRCIREAQRAHNARPGVALRPISALVIEGYWLDFDGQDDFGPLSQEHRSVVLLTDLCGYHTFYDFDRDGDGEPVLVQPKHSRRVDHAIYRPVISTHDWLNIWLEKVRVLEAARIAFDRIDWSSWERWRIERGATEMEAVSAALKEEGWSFSLTVLDVSPLYDRRERRDVIPERRKWPVRYAEPSGVRVVTEFSYDTLREALDYQWNTLGRAFEQNSMWMGADVVLGQIDGVRLPRLPAGGFESAMRTSPCGPCAGGPTGAEKWVRFGRGFLPLPVQY